jgi:glycosyltransferase involved in cell wall biosynthesis
MMKLLVTVPWGDRAGGAETMLWTFLRHVDRSRIEPTVVFFEHGPFEREVAGLDMRTAVVPSGRLRELARATRVIQAVRAVLRTEEPDLILNWSAKTQLYGASAAAAARLGDRVVWWQHTVPNGHWLDRLATLLPARAIGCSSFESSQAQAHLRPRRPSFVVHPGIEAPASNVRERLALRVELGLPQDRLVIGIVGRLQPWKGQHLLLAALAALREAGHAVHGLIVGGKALGLSPEYEPYLHSLADELGIRDSVTFTGRVAEGVRYLAAMDIFVNTSSREPFGIVLLEAMAAGLPTVAFDSGGPREIIEPGRSGLLVAERTVEALAAAIETLLVDPELRRRLSEAGRERVERRFTADRMTRDLEERLEELCCDA